MGIYLYFIRVCIKGKKKKCQLVNKCWKKKQESGNNTTIKSIPKRRAKDLLKLKRKVYHLKSLEKL